MRLGVRPQAITVTVAESLQLDEHEAGFLRQMARFCVGSEDASSMPGWGACKRLIAVLDRLGVPEREEGPVYGLFEERGR